MEIDKDIDNAGDGVLIPAKRKSQFIKAFPGDNSFTTFEKRASCRLLPGRMTRCGML